MWWMVGMQDRAKDVGWMSGDASSFPECEVID